MSELQAERNPVEVLADEFAERVRSGEHPLISEYTERFPEHATEIDELFPSILMMERLKEREDAARRREQRYHKLGRYQQIGDYQIVRQIGRGGMGVVFEAVQTSLGRRVALKVLSDSATASAKHLRRFEREARAAAGLHHTNIVPVFGVGHEDDLHFYVMQYIEGTALDEILAALRALAKEQASQVDQTQAGQIGSAIELARALQSNSFVGPPANSGSLERSQSRDTRAEQYDAATVDRGASGSGRPRFSFLTGQDDTDSAAGLVNQPPRPLFGAQYYKAVARVGLQVANALSYAHGQGVLHRDVKPGNLLLDPKGTIWVTDFGLAKLTEHKDLTNSGDIVGTLRYMAPEQFDGNFDARCDVYSVGLTLYELLTLRPACDDTAIRQLMEHRTQDRVRKPRALNPAVPRDLETIVLKTISVDPNDRYQTAEELAGDLERYLEDRPIEARRFTPVERFVRWSRRNPPLAAASTAVVLLLLLTAGTSSWAYFRSEAQREQISAANRLAEMNLTLALNAFEDIIQNLGSRGVAQAFDLEFESEQEEPPRYEAIVTAADAALLNDLLRFFDQFSRRNATNLEAQTAKAHLRMGDIQQRLGNTAAAREHYRNALMLYQRLELRRDPTVSQLVARAETLNHLAQLEPEWRHALRLNMAARDLLLSQPNQVVAASQIRFALAQTYLSMYPRRRNVRPSTVRRHVDMDDVLDKASRLLTRLREESPGNPAFRLALADAWYLKTWWTDRGDEAAVRAHEASLEILEGLVEDFPDIPRYRFELAGRLSSSCYLRKCHRTETRLARAISLSEELIEQFPSVAEYQRLLALCLARGGYHHRSLAEWEQAVDHYRAAIEIREDTPARAVRQNSRFNVMSRMKLRLAESLRELGELDQSREVLAQSIQEIETELARRPSQRPLEVRLAHRADYRRFCESLMLTLERQGLCDEAQHWFDKKERLTSLARQRHEGRERRVTSAQ